MMEHLLGTYKRLYTFNLLLITSLSLVISVALSILFWQSFSTSIYLTILFVLFAIVFEFSKIYAFTECYMAKSWRGKSIKTLMYVALTFISILGSVGGLHSLLNQNQQRAASQTFAYQQSINEIKQIESLIDEDKGLAKVDIAHDYRTQANQLLTKDIPALQKQLEGLKQERIKLSHTDDSPALLSIGVIPFANHISQQQLDIFLLMILATLIDLISAFLMGLSLSKIKLSNAENILEKVFSSGNDENMLEKFENNIVLTETFKQESKRAVIKSNVDDFVQRVIKNIENKVYEPKVTKIQAFEKVGYSKAKLALEHYLQTAPG